MALNKIFLGAIGVSLLSASLALFPALTAHAAVHSTGTLSASTVDAGSTVDLTITPADSGGVADWCIALAGDTSLTSSPGFSVYVILYTFPAFTKVWQSPESTLVGFLDQYVSPGLGSYTPDTVSSPMTVSITIPSDVPAGDYLLAAGCMGPTQYGRGDSTSGITGFITVNAAPDLSPNPETTPGTGLPDTGMSPATIGGAAIAGSGLLIGGALLVYRRRFAKR